MNGVVYFVAAPERIKIGYTTRPETRLSQLRASDFEKLEVIGSMSGDRHLERHLHKLVRDHRIKGEWFRDCEPVRSVVNGAMAGEIKPPSIPTPSSTVIDIFKPIDWPSKIEAFASQFKGNRIDWLTQASRVSGISVRTLKALYYREMTDPKYSVGRAIISCANLADRRRAERMPGVN